jgi:hypothetical protein
VAAPVQSTRLTERAQLDVADILASVEDGPRERFLDLRRTLMSWPGVEEGTYNHVGEWSPVYLVDRQQLLHVHFHKPHLISISLHISGRLGEAALAAPGVLPAMQQRIAREWRANEVYVEFRVNSAADRHSIEAAAGAIYRELAGARRASGDSGAPTKRSTVGAD